MYKYNVVKTNRRIMLENLRKGLKKQVQWADLYMGEEWSHAFPESIIQERIRRLREKMENCTYHIPEVSVQSNSNQDKLSNHVAQIADLDMLLIERERQMQYIESVQDDQMRKILSYRFILCKTWGEISKCIGDYYSDDYVRINCNRFLAKAE